MKRPAIAATGDLNRRDRTALQFSTGRKNHLSRKLVAFTKPKLGLGSLEYNVVAFASAQTGNRKGFYIRSQFHRR
jgi:hypothetical protein